MADIDARGERLNLFVKRGTILPIVNIVVTNDDGTPFDLTNCEITGQIRVNVDDAAALANFTTGISNAAQGRAFYHLPSSETLKLVGGIPMPKAPLEKYVWDMQIKDSFQNITPLYWGDVISQQKVTRP